MWIVVVAAILFLGVIIFSAGTRHWLRTRLSSDQSRHYALSPVGIGLKRQMQRLYPAQLALAQTEVNRRLVIIQLYKALGGGWNLTDAEFMTTCCSPVVQGNQP